MAYLTSSKATLVMSTPGFADLSLLGNYTDTAGNVCLIEAMAVAQGAAGDLTWDDPQPIDVAVQRWMTDGAVASTQGHENRSPYFAVVLTATTAAGLASAEAALAQRANKPCLLTWTPPAGAALAASTVFEVWTWHLEEVYDHDREIQFRALYGIRLTAKPWARSVNATTTSAVPSSSSPTSTSIDTCASLSPTTPFAGSWNGAPNTPTITGATRVHEQATIAGGGSSGNLRLTRTGSVTGLGSTPYLVLDTNFSGATVASYVVSTDTGGILTQVAQVGTSTYYALNATSFATLQVQVFYTNAKNGATVALNVADVSASSAIGAVGSGFSLPRSFPVGGSVKTSGSIKISSPSATNLGTCLVYTCPDDDSGYTPPLRRYRTTGNTVTADATAVSGFHEAITTAGTGVGPITFSVPAGQLPEGSYVIVGRYQATATGTLTPVITSNIVGYVSAGVAKSTLTFSAANTWTWAVVGVLSLPPQPMPVESQVNTNIVHNASGSAGNAFLDELYVCDVTHGALSLVNGALTRLWLDAPDVDPSRNRPALYTGTLDDRSDAAGLPYGNIMALGKHDFDPNGSSMFTVTDGVALSTVAVSFYHRWHTRAAD